MKALGRFLSTTLIGGLVFLLPLVLIITLLTQAVRFVGRLVTPIAERLPVASVAGLAVAEVLAGILLLLVCFAVGLFARTAPGRAVGEKIEAVVLRKIPGYTLMKGMTQGSFGVGGDDAVRVVLATLDDAWLLAFLIEESPDGLLTVFVPSTPTPTAGSLYFMYEHQVRRVDMSVREAIACIMQVGVGAAALIARSRVDLRPQG